MSSQIKSIYFLVFLSKNAVKIPKIRPLKVFFGLVWKNCLFSVQFRYIIALWLVGLEIQLYFFRKISKYPNVFQCFGPIQSCMACDGGSGILYHSWTEDQGSCITLWLRVRYPVSVSYALRLRIRDPVSVSYALRNLVKLWCLLLTNSKNIILVPQTYE